MNSSTTMLLWIKPPLLITPRGIFQEKSEKNKTPKSLFRNRNLKKIKPRAKRGEILKKIKPHLRNLARRRRKKIGVLSVQNAISKGENGKVGFNFELLFEPGNLKKIKPRAPKFEKNKTPKSLFRNRNLKKIKPRNLVFLKGGGLFTIGWYWHLE